MKPSLRPPILAVLGLAALVSVACSPTFNWRQVRPDAMGLTAMFPCKPDHETRQLPLAGSSVGFTVYACRTGDVTFAVGSADVAELGRVAPGLDALRQSAVGNLRAKVSSRTPGQVDGMTPSEHAVVIAGEGRLPDGRPVQLRVQLFTSGTRIYQATAFGAKLPPEVVEPFFTGLHLAR